MHYQTASKQAQEIDANSVRSQFPILGAAPGEERVVYLDSAASSQKPEAVLGAMEHYYRLDYANVHRGVYKLADRSTEAYERARRQVAAFFGVEDEEEIIFVRNATEAINLAAASWGAANLGPGDVVVTSVMEHHSNLIPWQLICERTGAGLEFVGIDAEGKLKLDDLDRLLAAGNVKSSRRCMSRTCSGRSTRSRRSSRRPTPPGASPDRRRPVRPAYADQPGCAGR
ncbi:MAG: aminotransferase class V-fold PLP-dependent enzyme [Thermomicrobiales bacterium]